MRKHDTQHKGGKGGKKSTKIPNKSDRVPWERGTRCGGRCLRWLAETPQPALRAERLQRLPRRQPPGQCGTRRSHVPTGAARCALPRCAAPLPRPAALLCSDPLRSAARGRERRGRCRLHHPKGVGPGLGRHRRRRQQPGQRQHRGQRRAAHRRAGWSPPGRRCRSPLCPSSGKVPPAPLLSAAPGGGSRPLPARRHVPVRGSAQARRWFHPATQAGRVGAAGGWALPARSPVALRQERGFIELLALLISPAVTQKGQKPATRRCAMTAGTAGRRWGALTGALPHSLRLPDCGGDGGRTGAGATAAPRSPRGRGRAGTATSRPALALLPALPSCRYQGKRCGKGELKNAWKMGFRSTGLLLLGVGCGRQLGTLRSPQRELLVSG